MNDAMDCLRNDIATTNDIRLLVDTFIHRASTDELLAPVFQTTGGGMRLDPLYRYWETVLLGEQTYDGVPFPKHADLPLTHQHFDRWLSLFHDTVEELFAGKVAEQAKLKAIRMSEIFRYKMELTNF